MKNEPYLAMDEAQRAEYLRLHKKLSRQINIETGYRQAINEVYDFMTTQLKVMTATGSNRLKTEIEEMENNTGMSFIHEEVK